MQIIPLSCPSCGANLTVDSSLDAAICEFCGKPYIVKDAIINNYMNLNVNQATIHTDAINLTNQSNFEIKAGKLLKYIGESQDVVIPDNVTEIGDSAFEHLNINNVCIPNGIIRIGRDAFRGCTHLKTIKIPSSVTEIAAWAFTWSGLESICLPNSISVIGLEAFAFCSNLKDVKVPISATVYEGAFKGTPYWDGKCQKCGEILKDAPFYEMIRGYSKICKKCGLVYKK